MNPFSSAIDMLAGLAAGDISSAELLDLHIDRIMRFDGQLNAVVIRDFERARATARVADQTRAAGKDAPLLGLPMTIKDCIHVEGLPVTGGVPERANAVTDRDAPTVARLRAAGAVFMGKTNVPPYAGDNQSWNPLFGRTNNPWNLDRTPGGSSGGAAAALAAGMTPLELGGDLGGSIRQPAAFCGIYGHKSSESAVPRIGHFPGGLEANDVIYLAVQGPLARTASDLRLMLGVIAGPRPGHEAGLRVELPEPRHRRLDQFRVAVLPPLDWLPVDSEILAAQDGLADELGKRGARVERVTPDGFGDFQEYFQTYLRILMAMSVPPDAEGRQAILEELRSYDDPFTGAMADGCEASASDYFMWFAQRERYRVAYRTLFEDWDVLLAPCNVVNAFPHTDVPSQVERYLDINGSPAPYYLQLVYSSLCNLSGHPGTAFPVGFTQDGLPIGLQAIGPYLEDDTTIEFARLVERELEGFRPPPGYEA